MNIYTVIDKLDEAIARTHAIILEHGDVRDAAFRRFLQSAKSKEAAAKEAESFLWRKLRESILEADNLIRDLMTSAKCPDSTIKAWERKRGYSDDNS